MDDYKGRLTRFYEKYNPDKVSTVDATLAKFAGKEEEMFKTLVKKYGPEPPGAADGGSGGPEPRSYQERVMAMYKVYKPAKIDKVEKQLADWAGQEEELIQELVKKWGPEPTAHTATVNESAPATKAERTYRDRVIAIYKAYRPSQVDRADHELSEWAGREEDLIANLVSMFGPEPGAADGGSGGPVPAALEKFQRRPEGASRSLRHVKPTSNATHTAGGFSRARISNSASSPSRELVTADAQVTCHGSRGEMRRPGTNQHRELLR